MTAMGDNDEGLSSITIRSDVASDVGVNFKNVGVLSIESSLFHLFHYAFYKLNTKEKVINYILH